MRRTLWLNLDNTSDTVPAVAVIHSDETLLDLLQYVLEQRGVLARAVLLPPGQGFADLRPFLPVSLQVCVFGLCPPYARIRALLAAFRVAYPASTVVLTTPELAAVGSAWPEAVLALVAEDGLLDRSLATIADAVCCALSQHA
jgi:hypothetical protein